MKFILFTIAFFSISVFAEYKLPKQIECLIIENDKEAVVISDLDKIFENQGRDKSTKLWIEKTVFESTMYKVHLNGAYNANTSEVLSQYSSKILLAIEEISTENTISTILHAFNAPGIYKSVKGSAGSLYFMKADETEVFVSCHYNY